MSTTPETVAPKREEQVLVLAAGGLTDKEIAIKLGISPDKVGTYWRRILAKYQAASRTEVVAKYTQDRTKAAVENLRYVNECLKLVADHMIEHAVGTGTITASLPDAILASLPDWVLLIDVQGTILFSNRQVPSDCHVQDCFSVDGGSIEEILALGGAEDTEIVCHVHSPMPEELCGTYAIRFAPCLGESIGHVVASGRRFID
jgi:DNA-binding CsgD family transcriptional regulator